MAGSLIKQSENSYLVKFRQKGTEGSVHELFDSYTDARKFWKSKQKAWTAIVAKIKAKGGSSTPEATKVKNHLKNLTSGSRINVILLARELDVPEHVVQTQLDEFFPNKFKRGKLYDPKSRRAFTYDGIKYDPKLFQYNKQGVTQNQTFWQNPPSKIF